MSDIRTRPERAPETAPAPPRPTPVEWLRWGWRQLTSMRTALVLLFLLAAASVPGSVLPQRGVDPQGVAEYHARHPGLAPLLDRLSLFDVFAAPWFGAIYLLLFTSLAGCVAPRAWAHLKQLRARPPRAPRRLSRLPFARSFTVPGPPGAALAAAAAVLARRRFRTEVGEGWVAAEKGYLREAGNLVFHAALLVLLLAVGAGALYGYKGNVVVTEGEGFANAVPMYDRYVPGRAVDPGDLAPFVFTLDDFTATYVESGERRGQPATFSADVRYRTRPGAPERAHELRVNHPLDVDGTKVYLLGHGYAPEFTVRDGQGAVAFSGAVPFLPRDERSQAAEGVVKVPDAVPDQLGFLGLFLPTTGTDGVSLTSTFPAARDPSVTLIAYRGDLGLGSGRPQSVYQLDVSGLSRIDVPPETLRPGESLRLPGGAGTITFTGYREWVSLAITYDPGRVPALVAAVLAVAGLVLSLTVRRRRLWVRVAPAGGAGGGAAAQATVVEVGGLRRTDAGGGGEEEFAVLSTVIERAARNERRE